MKKRLTLIPAALVLIFNQSATASTESSKICELNIIMFNAVSRPAAPGDGNQNQKITRVSNQIHKFKLDEKQGDVFSHSQKFTSVDGEPLMGDSILKSLDSSPESISMLLKKQQDEFVFSFKSGALVQQSDGRRTFDPEAFNIELKSKTPSLDFNSSKNKTPNISKIPKDGMIKITLNCDPFKKTTAK